MCCSCASGTPSSFWRTSAVEVAGHLAQRADVLLRHLAHLLGHLLEVRVDDVLLDLLEQLLKGLLGALVHELVALQLADRAARFRGQVVEVLAALLGDALEDPLRAPVGGVLEALVDALALEPQHVVELLLDVLEDVVEAVPLELLLALLAQPLHQLLEAGELASVAVAPALAEQAAQRRLEVPAVEDVLAQPVEERVGVIAERILGAVPDAEAVLARVSPRLRERFILHRPRFRRVRSC